MANEHTERRKRPDYAAEIVRLEDKFDADIAALRADFTSHYDKDESMRHDNLVFMERVSAKLDKIDTMHEIIVTWNKVKGAGSIIKFVSALIIATGMVTGSIVYLWHLFLNYLKGA